MRFSYVHSISLDTAIDDKENGKTNAYDHDHN